MMKVGWNSLVVALGLIAMAFLPTGCRDKRTAKPTPTLVAPWARPSDGMVMVYVPAGEFEMGGENGYGDEAPVHTVALTEFWIDRTEVTNAQYKKCVEAGKCESPGRADNRYFNDGEYPVIGVSWNDAKAYCAWAGGRLPTEAEWEYAARGPEGRTYPWGGELPNCDMANYWGQDNGCVGDISIVGSYPTGASWCGALDMAGNVWEWTADWYGEYPANRQVNPTGPVIGKERVLRGGSWSDNRSYLHLTRRISFAPSAKSVDYGFRCVVVTPGQ